jgi:hypothetical protein
MPVHYVQGAGIVDGVGIVSVGVGIVSVGVGIVSVGVGLR